MIEVNVGDDRNGRAIDDRRQPRGVGRILDGHAHDFAAFHRQAVDLFERLVGVGRIGRRHGLDDDGMVAADPHALRVGFAGLVLQERSACSCVAGARHYMTPCPLAMRAISWNAASMMGAISAAKPAK